MTVRRRGQPPTENQTVRVPAQLPGRRAGCVNIPPDQTSLTGCSVGHRIDRIGWPTPAEAARPCNVGTVGRPLIARRGTARDLCMLGGVALRAGYSLTKLKLVPLNFTFRACKSNKPLSPLVWACS